VLTKLTTVGDICINDFAKAQPANCSFYFVHKGYGGIVRSDIIPVKNVMWVNATAAADLTRKLKQAVLTLDPNVNGGVPISGQDYIVRINFRQYYGMSDEDIYQKYGAVHATPNMTAVQFYTEMTYSLFKNFGRLYSPALELEVGGAVVARVAKVNGQTKLYDAAGNELTPTSAGIKINEKSQVADWKLGTAQLTPVQFEVIPTTVRWSADDNVWDASDVVWGAVTYNTDQLTPINNSYDTADLEYFCMGERGDQYRNVMWPKSIPTKYLAEASEDSDGYAYLDIHYSYKGTCEDFQKSEKTLTIVGSDADIKTLLEALP
jgi:hypothetical protein